MELEKCLELWAKFGGQTAKEEAIELYNGIRSTPSGDVIEVGSASGGTTAIMLGSAETVGKVVYSIDPYPEEIEGKALHYPLGLMKDLKNKFKTNILNGSWTNIIQYNEDLNKCINNIPDKLSVIFIDGCHEFSFAQNEINLLVPKLVPGGYLYIHDTQWGIGQLSQTPETALSLIPAWIKENSFKDITIIYSMLRCQVVQK